MSEQVLKIRSVMITHLKSKGFPDLSHEEIIGELPAMWRKLEEEQLIQDGMTYQGFCSSAAEQSFLSRLRSAVGI